MTPRVSICVPNLNTRPFLEERFRTIFEQTFEDWELLVYDGYSEDGAWEYIRGLADAEPRMRAWQGPRAGTPGSWSPCVREARGEFVYIATSDDTMPPDCLQKLVAALDAHPECDIAHCRLRAIDEHGDEQTATTEWWARDSLFAQSSGPLVDRGHIRRAPLDGLLHLLGGTVYISITQLLIRRSLFDRIGLFESRWGSIGDFHWAMRAGLVADTVHVPDTWGGWRLHGSQATAAVKLGSAEHARKIDDMIEDAIGVAAAFLAPPVRRELTQRWTDEARALRAFRRAVAARRSFPARRRGALLVREILEGSIPARRYLVSRLLGRSPLHWLTQRMASAGCKPQLARA